MKVSKVIEACNKFEARGSGQKTMAGICVKNGAASWYSGSGVAWCDITVSAILLYACENNNDIKMVKELGYPQATINTSKARALKKFFRSPIKAKTGDVVFFRWNCADDDNFDHTGIVIKNYGSYMITFEGNANSDGKVHFYKRYPKHMKAFVRPEYESELNTLELTGRFDKATTKALQKLLSYWGYAVTIDGKLGTQTKKAWQKHLSRCPKSRTKFYSKTIDGLWGTYTINGTKKLLKVKGYNDKNWKVAFQKYLNDNIKAGVI